MARTANALDLLRRDHRLVVQMLRDFDRAGDEREQAALGGEIVGALGIHAALEEGVFYPFIEEASGRIDLVEEAEVEHLAAKDLMAELEREDPSTPRFRALIKVLGEYVKHHIAEEEGEIFPVVEKLGVDLDALGAELEERRGDIADAALAKSGKARPNGPRRARSGGHASHAASHHDAHEGARRAHGRQDGEQERRGAEGGEERKPAGDTTRQDKAYLEEHGDELSRSTQRAKWIHSVDDHEEHAGQTLATRNPDVIRQWAEQRGGKPATTPGGDPQQPRVLRFDFPDYDKGLQAVSWDAWLKVFENRELVFLFQEHLKSGKQSNFFRLDSPEREDG